MKKLASCISLLLFFFSVDLAAADRNSGDSWQDPVTGMEFVWLPKGCFEMGNESGIADENPVHKVCVDGFWMGKYEVTNAQYRQYKPKHTSQTYVGISLNGDDQPVVYVTWEAAKAYAGWLADKNNGKYKFRLPTEAEWEYACRAGSDTTRYWGDNPHDACQYSNAFDSTAKKKTNWTQRVSHNCDDGYVVTSAVGSFKPNAWGLFDMLGNAWEWCEDTYATDAYIKHKPDNPINSDSGFIKVLRGGSWLSPPDYNRYAVRNSYSQDYSRSHLGFRLLRR